MDELLDRIGRQPFRAKFHLRGRDRGLAQLHGPERLRRHAHDLGRASTEITGSSPGES